jgi:hypothetical protein
MTDIKNFSADTGSRRIHVFEGKTLYEDGLSVYGYATDVL